MRVLFMTFPVVAITMLSLAFTLGRGESEPERAPLANRIQTVCKKGFHVKDWLPESAYWGLETTPEEVVYVICESDSAAQFGLRETYGVVVKR